MSDSHSTRGHHPGSSAGGHSIDPFTAMASAMRDAWGFGMLALRSAAEQMGGSGTHQDDEPDGRGGNPFATAWESMLGVASQAAGTSTSGQSLMGRGAELQSLMTRASMVAASSAFNYWRQLMEVSGRHQAGLMAAMGDMAIRTGTAGDEPIADEQARHMTDEVRAYFREVGEVAVQEAHSMQIELERLGEELARSIVPPDPAAPHKRRAKAKH
jgi:hypothetical protein